MGKMGIQPRFLSMVEKKTSDVAMNQTTESDFTLGDKIR